MTWSEVNVCRQKRRKEMLKLIRIGLTASSALMISTGTLAADGKEIYNKACALCHVA